MKGKKLICVIATFIIVGMILSVCLSRKIKQKNPEILFTVEESIERESIDSERESISLSSVTEKEGTELETTKSLNEETTEQLIRPIMESVESTSQIDESASEIIVETSVSIEELGTTEVNRMNHETGSEARIAEEKNVGEVEETSSIEKHNASGDNWRDDYLSCDKNYYYFIINNMCNPKWYECDQTEDYYNLVFGLSDRYKQEHPFSEGSILKPYFPNIIISYGFTGDFDKREWVVEAYDDSNTKKFFLINFTVTGDYKLDTVSIRELADNEVGE